LHHTMIRAPAAAVLAVQKPGTKGRFGSRLCENAQEPTTRRIIFSITLLPIAATAPFVFRLTKSGRIFYAKIKRLRFHTASGIKSGSRRKAERRLRLPKRSAAVDNLAVQTFGSGS